MIFLLAVVFVAIWAGCALRFAPMDSIFSPVTFFGFGCLFYAFAVPLELALRGTGRLGTSGYEMSPGTGVEIGGLTITGFVIYVIFYGMLAKGSNAYVFAAGRRAGSPPWGRTIVLVAAGVVIALVFYRANIEASRTYYANVAQSAGPGAAIGYGLLDRWVYCLYAVAAFMMVVRARRWPVRLLVVVPLIAWSLYSNDKDPALIAALVACGGFISPWTKWRQFGPVRLVVLGAVALAIFGVGSSVFSQWRANEGLDLSSALSGQNGYFTSIDPNGPAVVMSVALNGAPHYPMGETVLSGLVSWVPRIQFPFETSEPAVDFAKMYYPGYQPGFGYGYSPVAEGWLGGGFIGMILVFGSMGAITALVRNFYISRRDRHPELSSFLSAASFVTLGYTSFVAMRGSFASFTFLIVYLNLVFIVVAPLYKRATRSRRPSRASATQSSDEVRS